MPRLPQPPNPAELPRPDKVLAHVKALLQGEERERARGALERLLFLVPRNVEALNLLGILHAGNGGLAEAVHCFDEALKADPGQADSWCNRGLALTRLGRFSEALADFGQAIRLRPQVGRGYLSHARTLYYMGHFGEAVAAYDDIERRFPTLRIGQDRGIVLLCAGRHAEAAEVFDRVLVEEPGNDGARFASAALSLLSGDLRRGFRD